MIAASDLHIQKRVKELSKLAIPCNESTEADSSSWHEYGEQLQDSVTDTFLPKIEALVSNLQGIANMAHRAYDDPTTLHQICDRIEFDAHAALRAFYEENSDAKKGNYILDDLLEG